VNRLVRNCPVGELSSWGIVQLGNCPVGELSVGKCPDNILHWLDNDVSEYSESNSEEEIASDDEGIEPIMAQQEQQPATSDIVDDDILMEEVVLWK